MQGLGMMLIYMPEVPKINKHALGSLRYSLLKELCHDIRVFLVTEAGWGSPIIHGRATFMTFKLCVPHTIIVNVKMLLYWF